jgi:hypothetical protein
MTYILEAPTSCPKLKYKRLSSRVRLACQLRYLFVLLSLGPNLKLLVYPVETEPYKGDLLLKSSPWRIIWNLSVLLLKASASSDKVAASHAIAAGLTSSGVRGSFGPKPLSQWHVEDAREQKPPAQSHQEHHLQTESQSSKDQQ